MGLLDVINGMQNGPRGQRTATPAGSGGGMSPITMAILGLLAYKAVKHFGGGQTAPAGQPGGAIPADTRTADAGDGLGGLLGSLGNLLPGGLGGLLAGGAAGGALSSGLDDLLKQFQQSGHGDVAKSWVGTGPNQEISPSALSKVLTPDQIEMITRITGMPQDELMKTLSQQLPEIINHMTPQGRLPTEHEASRMI
ncbi:MAG TPA: YidB family protein [Xanthobacteraceae bacterium]|jgi:uncharacterized protein YidB (DUF937 family)|nr:YidB family protein [Xanthobacteraceae bacterium]